MSGEIEEEYNNRVGREMESIQNWIHVGAARDASLKIHKLEANGHARGQHLR